MKKSLLLLASLLMSSAGFAQWVAPVPQSADMNPGDSLYLYNVGASAFYAQGNEYGTRASVSTEKGNLVVFKVAYEDEEETVPMGTYIFADSVGSGMNSLDCGSFDYIWVDGKGRAGDGMWTCEKQGDYYIIGNTNVPTGNFGVAQVFEGLTGNTRCYIYDTAQTYTYDDNGESMTAPKFSGEFWDKWIFVTKAEYEAVLPQVATYGAATALKAALDKAKAEYPAVDFSAVENVYNNTASTAQELKDAQAQIDPIIAEYKATLATFDNPSDLTSLIGDGSKVDPWTQTFTGTGTTGSHTTNTWSTEANNGADGTDMTTPFIEHWTGSGGILSDQKIFQTINVAPGLYKFTVNVRAYSEAGKLDAFEGLYMFFGNDTINLQEETPIFYSGSKSVLWSADKFSIIAVVEEAGDIELGFNIKGANFNWLAFKQTSLTYYGNEDAAANSVKLAQQTASYEKMEDVAANPDLVQAYNDAVDAFENAQSVAEVKAAIATLKAAKKDIDENIAAYEKLYEQFDVWANYLIINEGLEGDTWSDFCDFMESEDEIEGYPTPNPTVIKDNEDYSLLTPEIDEYIKKVDSLYSHAVATSLTPGANCTDMLVNPSFATGDFTGWTYEAGKLGDNNVECYEQVVDIYQIVKDVPDGIYSVSVQAFERPAGNGGYDGSEASKVFLFMNDFQTPVMNIVKDALPAEEAVDSVNCFINYDGTQAPNYPCDHFDANFGYVPNSIWGARFAFEAGRYTQKVYGLVEGGEMKLGLTSNGERAHWVIWANFKLIYEGKTEDALVPVLEGLIANMENYLEENADNMNNVAAAALQDAIAAATEAYKSTDVDVLWEGVIAANKAMADARTNVNAYQAFVAAIEKMTETANKYYDTASAKAQAAFDEKKDVTADGLTAEEINALTVQVEDVTGMLKVPGYESASDDEPVDMTGCIVNPDLSTGNADGWKTAIEKYTALGYMGAAYSNDSVSIDKFIEAWRDGNLPLGNGTIEQTIAGVPAGTYILSADIIANLQSTGKIEDTQGFYLFANEEGGENNAVAVATENGKPLHFEVAFKKASDDSKLTIGVKALDATGNWLAVDNFQLKYYGTNSSIEVNGDATVDIDGVESAEKVVPVAIYTISGTQVSSLQNGVNIILYSDGSTKKVLK